MLDITKAKQRITELVTAWKEYADLIVAEKGKLTGVDKKRIEKLEADLRLVVDAEPRSDLVVDVNEVARFFRVSVRAVQVWSSQRGCPKLRHGTYDLAQVHVWWLKNIYGETGSTIDPVDESQKAFWDRESKKEQALMRQMERRKRHGELIERNHVEAEFVRRVMAVKSGLVALERSIPPDLIACRSEREMSEVIRKAVRNLLLEYSRPLPKSLLPEEDKD